MVRRYLRVYDELASRGSRMDPWETNGEVRIPDSARTVSSQPATTSRLIRISADPDIA
jgi:hypothetical protein